VTGRHPLPGPHILAEKLGAWGISTGRQVVAYDDGDGGIAARLWWLLRWLGHPAVAVLDGGWKAWTAGAHPVSVVIPAPKRAKFSPRPNPDMLVDTRAVMAMRNGLVDARTADRFAGLNETIDPIAGHIPGAANLPYPDTTRPDKTSLQPAELKRLFHDRLGDFDPAGLAFYCGSGVTAARNILALEHAGLPGSRLYAGSWSEWIHHFEV
jgi:thiosulfate/3-mercaptopyruvate sulfurtransferase